MDEQIEHWLAIVTVAMPIVLGVAHGLRAVAERLYVYALSTPDPRDDLYLGRVVTVASWILEVANAIAHVASLGFFRDRAPNRTPSLERVEAETTASETPRAKGEP